MGLNASDHATEISQPQNGHLYLYISACVLFITFILFKTWNSKPADSKEPPTISSRVPGIGHFLNMMKDQAEYLPKLAKRYNLPMFTLRVFGTPIYIINSPELTQAVFKQPKVFSFDPISVGGSKKLFQFGKKQIDLLEAPIPGFESNSEWPLTHKVTIAMHRSMVAGKGSPILDMNSRALNRFSKFLDDITTDGTSTDLYTWLVERFTVATSVGLWGDQSPFENDRSLVWHLQNYEDGLTFLLLNVFPSITARKAHLAREKFKKAFLVYYERKEYLKINGLVAAREEVLSEGGFTAADLAACDIAISMGASMNSNPSLFWLTTFLFANPKTLAAMRAELAPAISTNASTKEACIDISTLLESCPLLVSSFQEMLRMMNASISMRLVMEDTLLNGTYQLKKGGMVQMPAAAAHKKESIWGKEANEFDAERFLKATIDGLGREKRKEQKMGYTPFGGGAALCPGRHFAMMEILGIVATLVLGFDIEMQDGNTLQVPPPHKQTWGVQVKRPGKNLPVVIRRRKEFDGFKWVYDVGEGELNGTGEESFNN